MESFPSVTVVTYTSRPSCLSRLSDSLTGSFSPAKRVITSWAAFADGRISLASQVEVYISVAADAANVVRINVLNSFIVIMMYGDAKITENSDICKFSFPWDWNAVKWLF